MATGPKEGFIEVVQQAETICKIQLSQTEYKKTAVFRKGLLLSWWVSFLVWSLVQLSYLQLEAYLSVKLRSLISLRYASYVRQYLDPVL